MDLLNAVTQKVSNAGSAVVDAAKDGATSALTLEVEKDIEKETGYRITVECVDIPSGWKDWVMATGLNSVAVDDSWDFLDESASNKPVVDLWKSRNIKKILLQVCENPDEEDQYLTTEVEWETGWDYFIVWFYPRAKNWGNSVNWLEDSGHKWWNLCDDIVFGLQLYQLPGKCFYKSDWLEGFEDVDPDGAFPWSTGKFKRWFQFRHWIIFWYRESQSGWNYRWTEKPPKLSNGLDFNLDAVLSLPSMPSLKMPSIKLPSLPNVSMPSLPSLPSISAPSLPSLSAPSLPSLPSLSAPSIPEKKKRPHSKWDAHGFVELEGLKVKASGKTLILSDATITHFWEKGNEIDDEKKEHQRLELGCVSDEQAKSWVETLKASGCEEGEAGGCCTVA